MLGDVNGIRDGRAGAHTTQCALGQWTLPVIFDTLGGAHPLRQEHTMLGAMGDLDCECC